MLQDPSVSVQRSAYGLVKAAALKHNEAIVMDAALDTSGATDFKLPQDLILLLQGPSLTHVIDIDLEEPTANSVSIRVLLRRRASLSTAMAGIPSWVDGFVRHVPRNGELIKDMAGHSC